MRGIMQENGSRRCAQGSLREHETVLIHWLDMKIIALPMLALLCAMLIPGMAGARDFLAPGDIERLDTSQAIVTIAQPGDPNRIKALRFPTVPDLQSCFSLAYTAASKSGGESSATCINERGIVAATYFCEGGQAGARCHSVTP